MATISLGRLLRTTFYTASGTWLKSDDVGSIHVKVIGGGGGGSTGGTTSFGSHLQATGGTGGAIGRTDGTSGTGSGGNLNFSGQTRSATGSGGFGLNSVIGGGGKTPAGFTAPGSAGQPNTGGGGGGGNSGFDGDNYGGGGGGGYSEKFISHSDLGVTETVTVGAGGASATYIGAGGSGLVIVHEYSIL